MQLSDGSLHCLLSPRDAQILIERGWGEAHLMAGKTASCTFSPISCCFFVLRIDFGISVGVIPLGLVMVYAPRDDKEVDIIVRIIDATYRYARDETPTGHP